MRLEITTGDQATEVEFGSGVVTVGGGEADGIRIDGLPERLLELRIDGERLMVVSAQTFTVDEVLSPAGVPRLVLAGERVGIAEGISLRQVAAREAPEAGTSAVLKQLLGDIAEPQQTRSAHLTCLTGLDVGRRFPIAGELADVGRGEDVHVRIRDRAVSRRHARIRSGPHGYTVEDLGAPNGVFVDGRPCRGQVVLRDGAILELGQSLLRFTSPAPEPMSEEEEPGTPSEGDPVQPDGPGVEAHAHATPPEAVRPARKQIRVEVALIGVGAVLAVIGAIVTFGVLG